MREILTGAILALAFMGANSASANTYYNFQTDPADMSASYDYGPFTATSDASFLGFDVPSLLYRGPGGLGVAGLLDLEPSQIDGMPAGVTESVSLSFAYAVRLVNFTVGLADFNDEYEFSVNGGPRQSSTLAFNAVDLNYVTSFEIFAVGRLRQDGLLGNDDFTLKGIEIASVPVPATLGLLGGALAALGLVRRRRT